MDAEYKNPKIYMICGKARHGKDAFSKCLKQRYEETGKKVIITQFSKYIKYFAIEMTDWDGNEKTKPREFLQKLGTDIIINKLKKEDIYINRVREDIDIFSYFFDTIIISDVRYKNEIIKIKKFFPKSISINIFRPNFDNGLTYEQKNHPTEIDLDDYNGFDEKFECISMEDIKEKVDYTYNKYS